MTPKLSRKKHGYALIYVYPGIENFWKLQLAGETIKTLTGAIRLQIKNKLGFRLKDIRIVPYGNGYIFLHLRTGRRITWEAGRYKEGELFSFDRGNIHEMIDYDS